MPSKPDVPRSPSRRSLALLLAGAAALPALAGEQILLGLVDRRGLDTFRSIQRDADGTYHEVTARGLRAGTATDASGETVEVRGVFKPTVLTAGRRQERYEVVEVDALVGGGQASLHAVERFWGGGTTPEEIFELPVSTLTDADLVEMFQQVLDAQGSSTVTSGIMLRSERPLSEQNTFSVRFAVRVRDPDPWTISGAVITLGTGKRVLRFVSTRRGRATFSINGVVQIQDVPVARGQRYLFDVPPGSLVSGDNALLLRIVDPDDGSSQELALTLAA